MKRSRTQGFMITAHDREKDMLDIAEMVAGMRVSAAKRSGEPRVHEQTASQRLNVT